MTEGDTLHAAFAAAPAGSLWRHRTEDRYCNVRTHCLMGDVPHVLYTTLVSGPLLCTSLRDFTATWKCRERNAALKPRRPTTYKYRSSRDDEGARGKYYTYVWVNSEEGPIYVGKGTGGRGTVHAARADFPKSGNNTVHFFPAADESHAYELEHYMYSELRLRGAPLRNKVSPPSGFTPRKVLEPCAQYYYGVTDDARTFLDGLLEDLR